MVNISINSILSKTLHLILILHAKLLNAVMKLSCFVNKSVYHRYTIYLYTISTQKQNCRKYLVSRYLTEHSNFLTESHLEYS